MTGVAIIRCDYCCGERCGLSLRRWVIRRVPRRLPLPALRRRIFLVPGPPQLSRARGRPPGRRRSVRLCIRMTGPRGPHRLKPNSHGSISAFDDNFAELSAIASSSREAAAACTDQVASLDIMVRQFMENNAGRVASRDDGDAQEQQRQKAQLATEMTTWNKVNTARKLWIIRGRIPPNLGDSPADLQSFVGEAIHVTANVASQLRLFSSFDVGAYGPRVDGPIGHSLMVADRLDLLRLAVVAIFLWVSRPGSPTISPVWRGSTPSATRLRWRSWACVRTHSATTACCPSQKRMQCYVTWLTATSLCG